MTDKWWMNVDRARVNGWKLGTRRVERLSDQSLLEGFSAVGLRLLQAKPPMAGPESLIECVFHGWLDAWNSQMVPTPEPWAMTMTAWEFATFSELVFRDEQRLHEDTHIWFDVMHRSGAGRNVQTFAVLLDDIAHRTGRDLRDPYTTFAFVIEAVAKKKRLLLDPIPEHLRYDPVIDAVRDPNRAFAGIEDPDPPPLPIRPYDTEPVHVDAGPGWIDKFLTGWPHDPTVTFEGITTTASALTSDQLAAGMRSALDALTATQGDIYSLADAFGYGLYYAVLRAEDVTAITLSPWEMTFFGYMASPVAADQVAAWKAKMEAVVPDLTAAFTACVEAATGSSAPAPNPQTYAAILLELLEDPAMTRPLPSAAQPDPIKIDPAGMAEGIGATLRAASQSAPLPTARKVGRNDPCTCGSGLKYKRCHGR